MELRSNNIRFRYGASGAGHVQSCYFSLNVWRHVLWVHGPYDSVNNRHTYKIYRNGTRLGTQTRTGHFNNNSVFDIGRGSSNYRSYDIDNVMLFDYFDISDKEVSQLYNLQRGQRHQISDEGDLRTLEIDEENYVDKVQFLKENRIIAEEFDENTTIDKAMKITNKINISGEIKEI